MKKFKLHKNLSILTFVIGFLGMIIVGFVDDEPIILNPLLMVIGIGWYIKTRTKIRSQMKVDEN